MIFRQTKLPGVFEIDLEPKPDERGFFARSWCQEEFESNGLNPKLVQCSISFNPRKGNTAWHALPGGALRGGQAGALHRRGDSTMWCSICARRSPTFKEWIAVDLTAANRNMIYVPEGCAHGFLTLEDETEVFYQMSEFYHPEAARGVRWDDPAFRIVWPGRAEVISERDRTYPDFE